MSERLSAVRSLSDPAPRSLLDDVLAGGPGLLRTFDRLARLASRLAGAPAAAVVLVTPEREVLAGCTGLPEPVVRVREAHAGPALTERMAFVTERVVVADAGLGPRPLPVSLPGVDAAAYAAVPLATHGAALGSLVVAAPAPRAWSEDEVEALDDLAAAVVAELERRAEAGRRRRAERALRMLDKAVQVMQLGVTVSDVRGRIVFTNAAEAAMHGYAPEDVLGEHAGIFAPAELRMGEDRPPPRRWFRESVNVRRDGSRFPVRLWSDLLTDEAGALVGTVTCCEDLTEIRAAEYAAAESESRFRFLAEAIPQQVWTAGPGGRVDYASAGTRAYFADAPGGGPDDWWLGAVHPDDGPVLRERWARSVASGEPFELEVRLRRRDGAYRWHLARALPQRAADGRVLRWFGTNTDITEQKAAAEALRASEERFRELAEHVREVFYITTPDLSRVLYVSPAYEHLWGRSTEDVYRNPFAWLEGVHPDDRAAIHAALAERASGRYDVEYRVVSPAGVERWVRDRSFPVRGPGGEVLRYVGFADDITERKRAERALREARDELEVRVRQRTAELARAMEQLRASEREYRGLFENAHDALLILDPAGEEILAANARAEELYGVPAGTLVGRSLRDHSIDPAAGERRVAETLDGTGTTHFVTGQRRADGAPMQVEVSAVLVDYRGRTAILSINRDVSARRRAEQALRRSEARFRAMFQSSAAGIALVAAEGRLVEANAALAAMLGHPDHALAGRDLPGLAHPLDAAALREGTAAALAEGAEHWRGELRFVDAGGRAVWAHVTLSAVAEGEGEGGGAERYGIAIVENVSERKAAEHALARSEEMLRHAQKLEAVGRLAGGIAHDFNNLLMAILTHVYALRHGAGDHDGTSAAEIERAAERGAALIRQLLAFSRREVPEPALLDLNAVVSDTERMARRLIGEDVRLDLRLAPAVPRVRADRSQLEQVVMNLLVNARDAMPEGGHVWLETAAVHTDGSVAGVPPGRYALLSVADTGHGMDADTRERIFEPFFTTKEVGRGTGLGLSTVYGIVQQAGGAVLVDSAPGQGTCFRLYFPAAGEEAAAGGAPEQPARGDPGHGTVLLVEDEPQLRAPLAEILRRHGYRVLQAGDAAEALRVAAQAGTVDLLLSDVVMPGGGGVELARTLAARDPAMRVLLMSGYAFDALGDEDVGWEVLAKPVLPGELAQRVRAALARGGESA